MLQDFFSWEFCHSCSLSRFSLGLKNRESSTGIFPAPPGDFLGKLQDFPLLWLLPCFFLAGSFVFYVIMEWLRLENLWDRPHHESKDSSEPRECFPGQSPYLGSIFHRYSRISSIPEASLEFWNPWDSPTPQIPGGKAQIPMGISGTGILNPGFPACVGFLPGCFSRCFVGITDLFQMLLHARAIPTP